MSKRFYNPVYQQPPPAYDQSRQSMGQRLRGVGEQININLGQSGADNSPFSRGNGYGMLKQSLGNMIGQRFISGNSGGKGGMSHGLSSLLIVMFVIIALGAVLYFSGAFTYSKGCYAGGTSCCHDLTNVCGDFTGVANCMTCNGMKCAT